MSSADERAGAVFAALADPSRRALLSRLGSEGPASASALAREVEISRQAVAKHLAVLAEARLVAPEHVGREVRYHVQPARLRVSAAWLEQRASAWDTQLAALKRAAEQG
ncbi:ArsR/SmtB family transcription factor [Actinomycetota bacterium]